MRSVFFGTPDFSLPSLEVCHSESELLAVISQPDRPRGRGKNLQPCPVKARALEIEKTAFSPVNLKKSNDEAQELYDHRVSLNPDIFVVIAYGNLLPQRFLDIPKLGAVNIHASLLPKWRGAAPIQRSIENGDSFTGVCLQKMLLKLDAGDVLMEKHCDIADRGAIDLTDELSQLGADLLRDFILDIKNSNATELKGEKQSETLVTWAPKIEREEALWSPSWSARETIFRSRAFQGLSLIHI